MARANPLSAILAAGRPILGAWLTINSRYVAEILGHAGFDTVTVDVQHGMLGVEAAIDLLQAVSATPAVPTARCSRLDPAEIGKLLDAGAYGLICPTIDTPEQAAELVSACRYPPRGRRSFGPGRAALYGGPDYAEHADDLIQVWAMVESAQAMENLESIVATPGLHGVYVGPFDLSLALVGALATDPLEPTVDAAMTRIGQAAARAGIAAGAFCASPRLARRLAERGYGWLSLGSDVAYLGAQSAAHLAAARGEPDPRRTLSG